MSAKTCLLRRCPWLSPEVSDPGRRVRYAARRLRRRSVFWLVSTFALLACFSGCVDAPPPALTGITIVAVGDDGQPDLRFVARTTLGPPVPVIGVQPGSPPKTGTFLWNEPQSGRIHITLARGRQSFTFHTTEWVPHQRYVVALFLNKEAAPAFVVDTGGEGSSRAPAPLGLEAELLPPQQPAKVLVRGAFEVTLERLVYPLVEPQLDLVGPWRLRPDNIADRLGVIALHVRERTSHGSP